MGEEAIFGACEAFYKKCFTDDRIKHWFLGISPNTMANKMTAFACYAFGGDDAYAGRDLAEAHAGLVKRGMSDFDFNVVVELFVEALKEGNVPDEMIGEIGAIVGQLKDTVLGRVPRLEGECPFKPDSDSGEGADADKVGYEDVPSGSMEAPEDRTSCPVDGLGAMAGGSSSYPSQDSMEGMPRPDDMVYSPIDDACRPEEELELSSTSDMHSNYEGMLSPTREGSRSHGGFHSPTPEVHVLHDGFRSPTKQVHRLDDQFGSQSRDAYRSDGVGGGPSRDVHIQDERFHNPAPGRHERNGGYHEPRASDRLRGSERDVQRPGEIIQGPYGEVDGADVGHQGRTRGVPRHDASYQGQTTHLPNERYQGGNRDVPVDRSQGWARETPGLDERYQYPSQGVRRPHENVTSPVADSGAEHGARGSASGGSQGLRETMRTAGKFHSSNMRRRRDKTPSPVAGMRPMRVRSPPRDLQNSQESMNVSDERYYSASAEMQRSGEKYSSTGGEIQGSHERYVNIGIDVQNSGEGYYSASSDRSGGRHRSPGGDVQRPRDMPPSHAAGRATASHGPGRGRQGPNGGAHRPDERVHRPNKGMRRAPTSPNGALYDAQGRVARPNDGMRDANGRAHGSRGRGQSPSAGMHRPRPGHTSVGSPNSPYRSRHPE